MSAATGGEPCTGSRGRYAPGAERATRKHRHDCETCACQRLHSVAHHQQGQLTCCGAGGVGGHPCRRHPAQEGLVVCIPHGGGVGRRHERRGGAVLEVRDAHAVLDACMRLHSSSIVTTRGAWRCMGPCICSRPVPASACQTPCLPDLTSSTHLAGRLAAAC